MRCAQAISRRGSARRPARESHWLKSAGFAAKNGELALIPSADANCAAAVLGLGKGEDPLALAAFAELLPPGTYALGDVPKGVSGGTARRSPGSLGTYAFARYRKNTRAHPKLVLPEGTDGEDASRASRKASFLRAI